MHTFSSFLSLESTSGLNDISVAFSMELLLNELLPQLVIRGTSDHMAGGCYVRAFSPFIRFFLLAASALFLTLSRVRSFVNSEPNRLQ